MRKELSLRILLHWILVALLLYVAMVSTTAGAAHAEAQEHPAFQSTNALQFTSAGHILGFQPQRLYLAALDHALSVEFLDARPVNPQSVARPAASGDAAGAPPLSRVSYPELWPGITLVVEATESGIAKSTFLLQPYADAAMIQLRYSIPARLSGDGSLEFELNFGRDRGTLTESAPVAWQDISGARVPVPVAFTVSDEGLVGFALGEYDPRLPLTIDPTYEWHTFYASASDANAMAVDGAGDIFITGYSDGTGLGDIPAPLHAPSGYDDIFVLKLSSTGAYQWHTFYGSNGDDGGLGIAVDADANVYVTGHSYNSWQGDGNKNPLHPSNGGSDLTVLKLSSNGAYQWHTFYGSSYVYASDSGSGIALDGDGNIYITGNSSVPWQGDGGTNPLHAAGGSRDILVLKLSPSGAYVWHTFYGSGGTGGRDIDGAGGITVGTDGNIYVTGLSASTWQGDGNTNPLHAFNGAVYFDVMVLKLSSSGAYLWHTFYGGTESDVGNRIALDGYGNIYVAGYSRGTWQGDGGANPLHAYSGLNDILVLKLSPTGAYLWHTFYGSSDIDYAFGLALDASANVYVTGESWKNWQGDGGANPLRAYSGQTEIPLLKLTTSGVYQWHTFYGSSGHDSAGAIAIDHAGYIYIAGNSDVNWQGDGGEAALHPYVAGWDTVIMKLSGAAPVVQYTNFLSLPIILNSH